MTKRDRLALALIARNKACEIAKQTYIEEVTKLNLPQFKIDWTEAMRIESKRQDLLIEPIRVKYFETRREAFKIYKSVV